MHVHVEIVKFNSFSAVLFSRTPLVRLYCVRCCCCVVLLILYLLSSVALFPQTPLVGLYCVRCCCSVVLLIIYLASLWFAMGDNRDEKKKSRVEMENLGLETSSRFSRDLLNRFLGSSSSLVKEEEEEEDEGEVELNLGLSLGGRFGVDKSDKKLIRSSSIAACLPTIRDDDALAPPPVLSYPAALVRTSSLPVETEEEWRKRKELQTLRRMEAKRRRSEKQRNLRGDKESGGSGVVGGGGGGSVVEDEKREIEMNLRGKLDKEQYLATAKRFGLSVSPTLAAVARQGSVGGGGVDLTMGTGKGSCSGNKMQVHGQPRSQGSVESQCGGSSSSMSELESKAQQGSGELSPASIHSLHDGGSQDVGSSGSKMKEIGSRMSGGEMESPSKTPDTTKSRAKEAGANTLGDMPCVFTKGDGPNGRRVDGILYKYGKGEEVRIMCVCHGSFHSPAEFVKHAGGTDVTHPLKHIVVNPTPSPFL